MKLRYDSTSSGGELSLVLFDRSTCVGVIFTSCIALSTCQRVKIVFFIVTCYLPKDKVNLSVLYFTPGVLPMN